MADGIVFAFLTLQGAQRVCRLSKALVQRVSRFLEPHTLARLSPPPHPLSPFAAQAVSQPERGLRQNDSPPGPHPLTRDPPTVNPEVPRRPVDTQLQASRSIPL